MKNNKKGQSAMEYLMTYGWAILIVIIAGGVIWYYASGATTSATATKTGFANVDIDSPWSMNAAGTLTFKAINKVGKDITINETHINGGANVLVTPVTLSAGATSGWISVATSLAGTSGSSYKLDTVAIQYYLTSDASKMPFSSAGSLGGTRN